MIGKRLAALTVCFFMGTSLAHSQSLVELARKEKERRARMKHRSSVVVTNADLRTVARRPAVRVAPSTKTPSREAVENPDSIPVRPGRDSRSGAENLRQNRSSLVDLEKKWKEAEKEVGELSLKLGGLWREFHTMGTRAPRPLIQQQISLTYLQLQKAKQKSDELKAALDRKRAEESTENR